jgi:Domain of unknown function (DUF222)
MGWRQGAGDGTGEEPAPGFGSPRHGASRPDASQDGDVPTAPDRAARDERLAGFAADCTWDTCPPSAELARVLAAVSGAEWRCPGATDDEAVGVIRRWAALESWAGAAKLGAIRALIRADNTPWPSAGRLSDSPEAWSESLTHELALALACSVGTADRTAWLACELGTRLPRIGALLAGGTLTYGKAKAVAEAFQHLTDPDAAHAQALIDGQLAGKTYLQVLRLAAAAASQADPDGDERRRKDAEQHSARVRLWREQSGAAALAGFDLPADQALAAHANVSARAEQYKNSGAFPGAQMDQLRAMAYLDLLNGVTAEARTANARAHASPGGPAGPTAAEEPPGGATGDTPDDDHPDSDGPGPTGSGDGGRPPAPGPDPVPEPASRPGTDLVIPLATLLHLGNRPGESHQFGPLDPALCRDLAALAAISPATRLCLTVTDPDGTAIGHGCARPHRTRQDQAPKHAEKQGTEHQGAGKQPAGEPRPALTALPSRVNLTIPLTDLRNLAGPADPRPPSPRLAGPGLSSPGPASRGSPWAFTPHPGNTGPPGGYGTWTLTVPSGRQFTVRLEQVPAYHCDHARESHAYQPGDTLRHLVQVRDGDCTFPPCTRHARETDFEHATPYHQGGRTCACNAGARSRRCHRIKQSPGWNVTQPQPGTHQWTTPTGRTYTQHPRHYPA